MMNNDSYNISISFKTNLAQLKMMEKARSTHFMSRSELIRSGIILMISKLAKSNTDSQTVGNTSNTNILDVSSIIKDVPVPSVDMFGTTSNTTPIDDDSPCAPSLYGWD